MANPLTEREITDRYQELLMYPSFIERLDEYELRKVHHYTSELFGYAVDRANSNAAGVEDSHYPETYLPGRQLLYWLERDDFYQDAKRVRELISGKLDESSTGELEIKPGDKIEWIESQFDKTREEFNSDNEWAKATSELFKRAFDTTHGSPSSMMRYAKYGGRR